MRRRLCTPSSGIKHPQTGAHIRMYSKCTHAHERTRARAHTHTHTRTSSALNMSTKFPAEMEKGQSMNLLHFLHWFEIWDQISLGTLVSAMVIHHCCIFKSACISKTCTYNLSKFTGEETSVRFFVPDSGSFHKWIEFVTEPDLTQQWH